MKQYKKTVEQFKMFVEECYQYASDEFDKEQKARYMEELAVIKRAIPNSFGWEVLANSGIFHDAIGKVIKNGIYYILVLEEY